MSGDREMVLRALRLLPADVPQAAADAALDRLAARLEATLDRNSELLAEWMEAQNAYNALTARLEATEAALRELQAMENEDCYRGTADGPCHGEQRRCRPCVLRAALAALDKETQG